MCFTQEKSGKNNAFPLQMRRVYSIAKYARREISQMTYVTCCYCEPTLHQSPCCLWRKVCFGTLWPLQDNVPSLMIKNVVEISHQHTDTCVPDSFARVD